MFKPSSDCLLTVPRLCFFCESFLSFMFHDYLCYVVFSVPCRTVITCWHGSLGCCVFLCLVTFPDAVLGHEKYLIVSIPIFALLSTLILIVETSSQCTDEAAHPRVLV